MEGKGNFSSDEKKMGLIEDLEERKFAFAKLKQELFEEAEEISKIFGKELALVVVSPEGDGVYSYACPSAESALTRYCKQDPEVCLRARDARSTEDVDKLRRERGEAEKELRAVREKAKAFAAAHKIPEDYVSGLSCDEFKQLQDELEGLKRDVAAQTKEAQKEGSASTASASSSMSNVSGAAAEGTHDKTDHIHHLP